MPVRPPLVLGPHPLHRSGVSADEPGSEDENGVGGVGWGWHLPSVRVHIRDEQGTRPGIVGHSVTRPHGHDRPREAAWGRTAP